MQFQVLMKKSILKIRLNPKINVVSSTPLISGIKREGSIALWIFMKNL